MSSPHTPDGKDTMKNLPEVSREDLVNAIVPGRITYFRGIYGKKNFSESYKVSMVSETALEEQIGNLDIQPLVFQSRRDLQKWMNDSGIFGTDEIFVNHPLRSKVYVVYPLGMIRIIEGLKNTILGKYNTLDLPPHNSPYDNRGLRGPELEGFDDDGRPLQIINTIDRAHFSDGRDMLINNNLLPDDFTSIPIPSNGQSSGQPIEEYKIKNLK